MFKRMRNNIMIEKLREIEDKYFDTEDEAAMYAAYAQNIFKTDFDDLKYEVEKVKLITIEGPEIGKWVDNYVIHFRFREM